MPRRIIFDTNVCQHLATFGDIKMQRILAQIGKQYKICVSPNTFLELLDGLAGGKEEYFPFHQRRLRAMAGNGKSIHLAFPVTFAVKAILNIDATPSGPKPSSFQKCLNLILKSNDRASLDDSPMELNTAKKKQFVIHFHQIQDALKDGKSSQLKMIESLQQKPVKVSPLDWLSLMTERVGVTLTNEQMERLSLGLNAAVRYFSYLNRKYNNPSLNGEKKLGDWVDWQQLFYLANPSTLLITNEKQIVKECEASSQGDRVILLEPFLKTLGIHN